MKVCCREAYQGKRFYSFIYLYERHIEFHLQMILVSWQSLCRKRTTRVASHLQVSKTFSQIHCSFFLDGLGIGNELLGSIKYPFINTNVRRDPEVLNFTLRSFKAPITETFPEPLADRWSNVILAGGEG